MSAHEWSRATLGMIPIIMTKSAPLIIYYGVKQLHYKVENTIIFVDLGIYDYILPSVGIKRYFNSATHAWIYTDSTWFR